MPPTHSANHLSLLGIAILGLVACGETPLGAGAGGAAAGGGRGGAAGVGASAGSGGTVGVANPCEGITCEDDGNPCTGEGYCSPFLFPGCQYRPVEDSTVCAAGAGICLSGSCVGRFPCTERGIRDAIDAGGGPHTFECDEPAIVTTEGEMVIDKDVTLDGENNLTLDGNASHRVFLVEYPAVVELRRLSVTNGSTEGQGGGIKNRGMLTLTESSVSGSRARDGGGIENGGVLYLRKSLVQGNTAEYAGGIAGRRTVLIDSLVTDNAANNGHAGGMDVDSATLIRSAVSRNTGGGMYVRGTAMLTNSAVTDNVGGGIFNAGTLVLTQSTVSGNVSSDEGGGIVNLGTPYVIAYLTLTSSTISGNSAEERGGGIHNNGEAEILNSTISGNSAGIEGGGIYNRINGRIRIRSSSVSGNSAPSGSGIYYYDGFVDGELTLTNSLIDGTCAGSPIASEGGNIESPAETCAYDQPTDRSNVSAEDIGLGPLRDNGGPTETHALGAGSVAIDAIPEVDCVDGDGEPLTEDQREAPRPEGAGCDVGAYEVQP